MNRPDRKGFTLVELLVVIVIISMLVGLAVPALISARARARRTQCGNNQHELALAFQQYENAQGHLPGYVNRVGSVPAPLAWPVVLLQYIGRNDLWERWRVGTATPGVTVSTLRCPVDLPADDGGLSYVVNCGIQDGTSSNRLEYDSTKKIWKPYSTTQNVSDDVGHGVFLDRFNATPPPVRSEKIPDGRQETILISENIQAGYWYDTEEAYVGIVWDGAGPSWDYAPSSCGTINSCMDRDSRPSPPDYTLARPSSNHPGGAVVTYCDGHSGFLNENMNYHVYISEMTPDNARVKGPPDTFE